MQGVEDDVRSRVKKIVKEVHGSEGKYGDWDPVKRIQLGTLVREEYKTQSQIYSDGISQVEIGDGNRFNMQGGGGDGGCKKYEYRKIIKGSFLQKINTSIYNYTQK